MRCRKAHWFLSARCDGTLSERQRVRLDEHLKSCTDCRREAFYFSEIGAVAGRLEKKAVRPDFNIRLRAAIGRSELMESQSKSWYKALLFPARRLVFSTAVVSVAVALSLSGFYLYSSDLGLSAVSGQSVAEQSTGAGLVDQNLGPQAGTPSLPAGWTPVDGTFPNAEKLQERYLAAARQSSDYVLETVRLDDPINKKPEPHYIMPVMSSDQMVRQVSY